VCARACARARASAMVLVRAQLDTGEREKAHTRAEPARSLAFYLSRRTRARSLASSLRAEPTRTEPARALVLVLVLVLSRVRVSACLLTCACTRAGENRRQRYCPEKAAWLCVCARA
jgi:hypothetical protein